MKERTALTAQREVLHREYDRNVWTLDEYKAKLAELDEEDKELKAALLEAK